MKSVRLSDELEQRLQQAARITGQPVSQIIRDAIVNRCDELLGEQLDDRLADVIGGVASGGGKSVHSRRTGQQFTRILKEKSRLRGKVISE